MKIWWNEINFDLNMNWRRISIINTIDTYPTNYIYYVFDIYIYAKQVQICILNEFPKYTNTLPKEWPNVTQTKHILSFSSDTVDSVGFNAQQRAV